MRWRRLSQNFRTWAFKTREIFEEEEKDEMELFGDGGESVGVEEKEMNFGLLHTLLLFSPTWTQALAQDWIQIQQSNWTQTFNYFAPTPQHNGPRTRPQNETPILNPKSNTTRVYSRASKFFLILILINKTEYFTIYIRIYFSL